jgi:hypothetical protein
MITPLVIITLLLLTVLTKPSSLTSCSQGYPLKALVKVGPGDMVSPTGAAPPAEAKAATEGAEVRDEGG